MTAIKLTAAQAKALGIAVTWEPALPGARVSTRQRRVARGPYHTVCFDCHTAFTTQAAETRHLHATRHARYELVVSP